MKYSPLRPLETYCWVYYQSYSALAPLPYTKPKLIEKYKQKGTPEQAARFRACYDLRRR